MRWSCYKCSELTKANGFTFAHTFRYDCRGHLYDKSQFGLKSNLPRRWTAEEEEFEEMLDRERYIALNEDLREEDIRKGGHQLEL